MASRETIVASSFLEPSSDDTDAGWELFSNLLAANGGHPKMAKELKHKFLEAGFSDIQTSGSFDFFGSDDDVAFLYGFIVDWFFFARRNSGGRQIRAGYPGAIRHSPPRARPVEGPSGRMWSHRIRRGYCP